MTLARLLRGSLTVESRLGDGSVFTLTIPKSAPQEVDNRAAPRPA
jgi:signal transduction histidine kinase